MAHSAGERENRSRRALNPNRPPSDRQNPSSVGRISVLWILTAMAEAALIARFGAMSGLRTECDGGCEPGDRDRSVCVDVSIGRPIYEQRQYFTAPGRPQSHLRRRRVSCDRRPVLRRTGDHKTVLVDCTEIGTCAPSNALSGRAACRRLPNPTSQRCGCPWTAPRNSNPLWPVPVSTVPACRARLGEQGHALHPRASSHTQSGSRERQPQESGRWKLAPDIGITRRQSLR